MELGLFDELSAGPLAGFPVLRRGAGVGFCFTRIPVSTRFRLGEAAQGQPRVPSAPSWSPGCLHTPGLVLCPSGPGTS